MIRMIQNEQETNKEEMGEMGQWGKGWNRMNRQGYTVSQLEMIIAESGVETQAVAAALIWASKNPTEEVFEIAAKLARVNTVDELWAAYYSTASREVFVGTVLAIIHYDLLAELNNGEYYSWIEIKYEGNKYWRTYPNKTRK